MKTCLIKGLAFYCVICFSAQAQAQAHVQAQSNKMKFHSVNTGGIVVDESRPGAVFQSINGIKFSDWFLGVGIGVDYYQYKTLPLFFDARRFFGRRKMGFVYGEAGYDFTLKNKPGKDYSYVNTYSYKGGLYTDFGIGVKTKFIKSSSLLFSLGHSYKEVQGKYGVTICPFIGPCYIDYSYYKFKYGRLILKAGVEF